jgi:hypothetical protein
MNDARSTGFQACVRGPFGTCGEAHILAGNKQNTAPTMSTTRHIVLGVALLAVLALTAVLGVARAAPSPDGMIVTAMTSDRDSDDGWPPTTGPTNPAGYAA